MEGRIDNTDYGEDDDSDGKDFNSEGEEFVDCTAITGITDLAEEGGVNTVGHGFSIAYLRSASETGGIKA